MIVPMKKIHLVVQKKDSLSALESLRELGSIHVEHQEDLTGAPLEQRREDLDTLARAIDILKAAQTEKDRAQKKASQQDEIVGKILDLSAEIDRYKEAIAKRQTQISQWEAWGHFDPKDVEELLSSGIKVQLCMIPKDKKKDAPEDIILKTMYSESGIDRCVVISGKKTEVPFETIKLPSVSLNEMRMKQ